MDPWADPGVFFLQTVAIFNANQPILHLYGTISKLLMFQIAERDPSA